MKPQPSHDTSRTLRRALKGNGAFSILSGLGILIFAGKLTHAMGLSGAVPLYVVAPGLLLFGASVFVDAGKSAISQKSAVATIVMDALWVIGSGVLLLVPVDLSVVGKALIAITALIVGAFAVWQYRGLQVMKRSQSLERDPQGKAM